MKRSIIFGLVLISILFLSGCAQQQTQYVCPDGTTVFDASLCPREEIQEETDTYCGDGICQSDESCSSCSSDCGECEICDSTPSIPIDCYNKAATLKDIKYCNEIKNNDESKWECYGVVAVETKNDYYCDLIDEYYTTDGENIQDACYSHVAPCAKDESICRKLRMMFREINVSGK